MVVTDEALGERKAKGAKDEKETQQNQMERIKNEMKQKYLIFELKKQCRFSLIKM